MTYDNAMTLSLIINNFKFLSIQKKLVFKSQLEIRFIVRVGGCTKLIYTPKILFYLPNDKANDKLPIGSRIF